MSGDQPRTDAFFDGVPMSTSEELLEGVLIQAADAYEERKIPFIARLYASILFDEEISAQYAHFLLRVAERLTYRQLALLALLADEQIKDGRMFHQEHLSAQGADPVVGYAQPIGAELVDLGAMGLIGIVRAGRLESLGTTVFDISVFEALRDHRVEHTRLGQDLHRLAGLDRIPRARDRSCNRRARIFDR